MRPRSCGGLLTRLKVVWDGSAPLITPVNLPHLSPPPSGMAPPTATTSVPPRGCREKQTHISREFVKKFHSFIYSIRRYRSSTFEEPLWTGKFIHVWAYVVYIPTCYGCQPSSLQVWWGRERWTRQVIPCLLHSPAALLQGCNYHSPRCLLQPHDKVLLEEPSKPDFKWCI